MKLDICKVHVNYRTLFLDYWHTDYWRSLVLMIWCQLACAISNKGLWKCFSVCKLPVISIYFHDPWIETFILLPPPPKKKELHWKPTAGPQTLCNCTYMYTLMYNVLHVQCTTWRNKLFLLCYKNSIDNLRIL